MDELQSDEESEIWPLKIEEWGLDEFLNFDREVKFEKF